MKYSPNKVLHGDFKMYEVARSSTAVRLGIDNTPSDSVLKKAKEVAIHILQPVRDEFGSFTPSSWFRCEALEKAITVKGFARWMAVHKRDGFSSREEAWAEYFSRKSHPKGEAVDFEIVGVSNIVVFDWCKENLPEFDQLIEEFMKPSDPSAGWIHGSYSTEHNRNEIIKIGRIVPPENDKKEITMSRWELEKEREHAVIAEKLKQLDGVIPKLFTTMESLDKKVTEIPMEILSCRDQLDKTQKEYMHKEFVTNGELTIFESKLEKKFSVEFASVNKKIGRASWLVSGFIAAATAIFWVLAHTNITVS